MKQELVPEDLLTALKEYSPTLVQASQTIREQGVTKYPIFIATQAMPKVGIPLIMGVEYKREWNINASSLEELFTKKIMTKPAANQFRKVFKDPNKFFCVFLIEKDGLKLLYVPIDKQFLHIK